jgi:hypothetical protein
VWVLGSVFPIDTPNSGMLHWRGSWLGRFDPMVLELLRLAEPASIPGKIISVKTWVNLKLGLHTRRHLPIKESVPDFHVELFAKQGHRNIVVKCNRLSEWPDNGTRWVSGVAWRGNFGYYIAARVRFRSVAADSGLFVRGGPTNPYAIWIETSSSKHSLLGMMSDPPSPPQSPRYNVDPSAVGCECFT